MKNYILLLMVLSLGLSSCSDEWMGDVLPTDNELAGEAFKSVKDGRNAVNGVFSLMQHQEYYGADHIVYGDLKAIDVQSKRIGARDDQMYLYRETTEASATGMWTRPYKCLVSVNNALENLDQMVAKGEDEVLRKAEIEANFYALRGLIHFDLLKIYSRIPAAVEGDVAKQLGVVYANRIIDKSEKPTRENLQESYDLVINDLNKAIELMPDFEKMEKKSATEGWFSLNATKALLARVYLFNGQNQKAYDLAKEVIDSNAYALVPYGQYKASWTSAFNNSEAILTLINTDEDNTSREGVGNLWHPKGYNTMVFTNSFLNEINSNPKDDRINAIYKNEIKKKEVVVSVEYISLKYPEQYAYKARLIRLSEMYFIAAEAIYKVNNANAAEAAGLINEVLAERLDESDVLDASDINIERIVLEKRKEFVGEGMTFFDLMRNRMDVVRTGEGHLAGAPEEVKHNDFRTIQPIPRLELNVNTEIQQNPDYAI